MTTPPPEDVPTPYVCLYRDEPSGAPIYQCYDCVDDEDDGLVLDIPAHQAWHRAEDFGELHSLAGFGCSWSDVPPERRPHVPISREDAAWAERFRRATNALAQNNPGSAGWVRVGQNYQPCSRRGTHSSLDDCWICYSDVLRGDTTRDEVLLPLDARDINRDPLAFDNPWDVREPDSGLDGTA